MKPNMQLTHIDSAGRPGMVDVSTQPVSARRARAEARVRFPPEVLAGLRASGWQSAKGAVLATAIVAGTQAVKRTAEWIPFCHPIPIDRCRIDFEDMDDGLRILCEVSAVYRTGVEMEALTGAAAAALTVIDMCKALSPALEIAGIAVLEKTGGKREYRRS